MRTRPPSRDGGEIMRGETDTGGTFIVIEGLDASGKATQAERLVERLEREGEDVRHVAFPAYETAFGGLVRDYLKGAYGDRGDLPVELRALLYAADRYQFKHDFSGFLDQGGVIVADRYSQSNYAFQTVDAGEEQDALLEWMRAVESRLPQPDAHILLDTPPETAQELMKDRDKDQHEADRAFQRKVYQRYRALAAEEDWHIVEAVAEGRLRSKDAIHTDIWSTVKPLL